MYEFLENIAVFQIFVDVFDVFIGAGLCFGALKWRKGLLTSTAIYWGLFLGAVLGLILLQNEPSMFIVSIIIGAIIFPILTYTISGVNRFVLGFVVATKLTFMFTTVMAKEGSIDLDTAIFIPFIIGTIIGLLLMAWTKVRVSAFVGACAFIGASQLAGTISKYINQFLYGITGDFSYIFDPIDFIFALMKIELTDLWMLFAMLILMPIGIIKQLKAVKEQGFDYNIPLIVYETKNKKDHGKIVSR